MHKPIEVTPPEFLQQREKKLLINGKWVNSSSGQTFSTVNPSTGKVIAEIARGDATDVDYAVKAARRAFDEGPWRFFKPAQRQHLLLRLADLVEDHFDELSTIDTIDMGVPISRSRAGRNRAVSLVRYYAGLATTIQGNTIENSAPGSFFSYTLKDPVGVVGAIIPWNGPLGIALWKLAPALATGCTVVLKPAEQASLSPLRLGELIEEAGFPPGVINIVTGFGDVGAAISNHPCVDKVSFTGSTETGRAIIRASAGNIKRLSLELGGKSADIVFADADLDNAVAGAAMAGFNNSGQVCSAGTRLFVEESIREEFIGRLTDFTRSLIVGNSQDINTQLGPLVSEEQMNRVMGYCAKGQEEGAQALTGGVRLTEGNHSNGFFVAPTVFSDVIDTMTIAREEIFGPVISVLSFNDIDDVIRRANESPYGLGGGVWSRDVKKVHKVSNALRTGTVWANCYQVMDPAIPFGGYKASGYGRESGMDHLNEFLNIKSVVLKLD